MRCWTCGKILVVPDRDQPIAELHSLSHTVNVVCNTCGSIYDVTTTKKPGRMVKVSKSEDEEESRGWR